MIGRFSQARGSAALGPSRISPALPLVLQFLSHASIPRKDLGPERYAAKIAKNRIVEDLEKQSVSAMCVIGGKP